MVPITIQQNGELVASRCTCGVSGVAGCTQALSINSAPTIGLNRPPAKPQGSYHEILKSSALVGGSQVANITIGIVRTKAMAVLLGPGGFGLFGVYGSIANLTESIDG